MTARLAGARPLPLIARSLSTSWVIVDSQVDDLQVLVDAIAAGNQVFILDQDRDGVEQITQLLHRAPSRPDALHLIAHGAPGVLHLGNSALNLKNIDRYANSLKAWQIEDLLIYACRAGAGDAGEEFLTKLHQVTNANIAASSTKVGHADLGGNWQLDVAVGAIAPRDVFRPERIAAYSHVLVTKIYTIVEDNEDNARTGNPDGDFGENIRIGASGGKLVVGVQDTLPNRPPGDPDDVSLGMIQPIEFNIPTDVEAEVGSAFLFLSVFDVDLPDEKDRVTFNGTVLGLLEGEDKLNFKSVFPLDPSQVLLGDNFVQIEVDIDAPPNRWEAEITKAELLINYIIGEPGPNATTFIDTIQTEEPAYNPGDTVNFLVDFDTTLPNQNLQIEAILRDPQGNAVDFDSDPGAANFPINNVNGVGDNDQFTWSVPLPTDAQTGEWRIDVSVFDADTGEFQVLGVSSFPVGCGDPAPVSVFQFDDYVRFEEIDESRVYQGVNATFSEEIYLLANPSVADAVAAGVFASGTQHYEIYGANEGRSPLPLDLEIGGLKMASLFDETYYLNQQADVLAAFVLGQFVYGFEHFVKFGIEEGRSPSLFYDEGFYLATNADVADAVGAGLFSSGLEHFIQYGHLENRDPSELFDASDYLLQNPDVEAAVQAGTFDSAFDHYIENGAAEGRIISLLFEELFYLEQNPQVAAAVAAGAYQTGFDHYIAFGQEEGRDPSPLFDESAYLGCYPDVATAVEQNIVLPGGNVTLSSGMEHYFRYGRQEGRVAFLVPEVTV